MQNFLRSGLLFWLLFHILVPSRAQVQSADVVFQAHFDEADALNSWLGIRPKTAHLETGYLGTKSLAMVSPVEGKNDVKIEIPLPVERLRGARVRCEAMVKAENVLKPQQPYNGIKLMLHHVSPQGERWDQQNSVYGTFDWKPVSFTTSIPLNTSAASLILGIENTTGRVWFDDIRVSIVAPPRTRPAKRPNGPVYTGHNQTRLRGAMISPNLTATDLKVLCGAWKANHIRWQLLWNGFPHSPADKGDTAAYNAWLEGALQQLDRLLPLCRQLGVLVVIDLHTPPGGRNEANEMGLFREKRFQRQFLEIWDNIARRYRRNPAVWGYDLVNEPVEGNVSEGLMNWHDLATAAARRVRAVDAQRAIIVEPAPWGGPEALEMFEPIPIKNVVYSVHMYVPHTFTHQGVDSRATGVAYPGTVDGKMWDKAALRAVLQPVVEWQRDYGVHIYIGEFSAIRWAPDHSAFRYLRDCIDIFEENNWDWAYHAFREWNGWSIEHGDDPKDDQPAKTPTDREELLRSWFAKNQRAKTAMGATPIVPIGNGGSTMSRPAFSSDVQSTLNTRGATNKARRLRFSKWLAIGDSITAHGPSEALKWLGPTRGMAASALETDYLHLLRRLLQVEDAGNVTELNVDRRFGKLSSGTIEQMNTALDELRNWGADLVTVQLGENDRLAEIGHDEFERRYRILVEGLLASPKKPLLICTGVWSPGTPLDVAGATRYAAGSEERIKDDIIQEICREKGGVFVPVAPFAVLPQNHGAGEDASVQWHPNNAGMRAYAQAIFQALMAHGISPFANTGGVQRAFFTQRAPGRNLAVRS